MKTEDTDRIPRSGRAALAMLLLTTLGACATSNRVDSNQLASEVPSARSSLEAGDEAARTGDLQRALALYLRAVSMESTVEGWLRVGAASERLGNRERALYAYLHALELEPGHIEAHQGAGLGYLSVGDDASAALHLTRVVEQDPKRWRARNALGIVADRAGDHASAIGHYEAALEIHPQSPMLLNNLGYSRYLAGDLEQAARTFTQVTRQYPAYEAAWSNLAMVYAELGWYDDAVEIFTRVVDRAAAHNDVGYIAYQKGDLIEAEWLLREAVRLSPTYYPAANQNLERVRARLRNGASGGRTTQDTFPRSGSVGSHAGDGAAQR